MVKVVDLADGRESHKPQGPTSLFAVELHECDLTAFG